MLRNGLNFAFHFLSVFVTDKQTVRQGRRCGRTALDSEQHAALHNKTKQTKSIDINEATNYESNVILKSWRWGLWKWLNGQRLVFLNPDFQNSIEVRLSGADLHSYGDMVAGTDRKIPVGTWWTEKDWHPRLSTDLQTQTEHGCMW